MKYENYEDDFIYNLLIEAGYLPDKDDFDSLKEEIEPLLMDKIVSRVFGNCQMTKEEK